MQISLLECSFFSRYEKALSTVSAPGVMGKLLWIVSQNMREGPTLDWMRESVMVRQRTKVLR
jgi:hypothetical protein